MRRLSLILLLTLLPAGVSATAQEHLQLEQVTDYVMAFRPN